MQKRFYFDLTNGQKFIRDDEGVEADDIDQATKEAQVVLNEMRGSQELSSIGDGWRLIIRDENGRALRTMPLD